MIKTLPNNNRVLVFPAKVIRAQVIARHVQDGDYPGVVIFSSGNAAKELRRQLHGEHCVNADPTKLWPHVIEVGPNGVLGTEKWWTPAAIHRCWSKYFDATSGHLPFPLMVAIAARFKQLLDYNDFADLDQDVPHYIPTGSGETIICLQMAYPERKFIAVYDETFKPTVMEPESPLTGYVKQHFNSEHWKGKLAFLICS